ncbi:MAG: 3-phosphoshikimate 1-carboxyvinyltransferase [Rikenellaceae bacterium]
MDYILRKANINGTLAAPASKSYAQRAVAAALLAKGESTLFGMELCNDTQAALDTAERLGAKVEKIDDTTYKITGGLDPIDYKVNIGESGLATRLFTPICTLADKEIVISGHGSIMNRPIDMMQGPLSSLGAKISTTQGYLPIECNGGLSGGEADVDGSLSSQFVSGLLLALPLAKKDSLLHVSSLKSRPYVDMTISVAESFGVEIAHRDYEEFFIEGNQQYTPTKYSVEGDWSGASCLLVAGALAGEITVKNLLVASKQADMVIVDALSRAGAMVATTADTVTVGKGELKGFEFDATHCPDLFPALAALASGCKGTSKIKGVSRLKYKESDRAQTIADIFGAMGIEISYDSEVMTIEGGEIKPCSIDSHNDHRIAMAAAVAALRLEEGQITLSRGEAVDKSYPLFWEDIEMCKVKE